MLLLTTLHYLLYPPLKGFSQIQDKHMRVYLSLPKSHQGVYQATRAFKGKFACKMWDLLKMLT